MLRAFSTRKAKAVPNYKRGEIILDLSCCQCVFYFIIFKILAWLCMDSALTCSD